EAHRPPGDGDAEIGQGEAVDGGAVGGVEIAGGGGGDGAREVEVEGLVVVGGEAGAAHRRRGRRRGVEQGRVAEGAVGGVDRGAQRGGARSEDGADGDDRGERPE